MLPKPDLEGIVLRLEDPFHGTEEALGTLKSSNLTGLADVQQYARRLMDVYQTVTGRIDKALEQARARGQTVIDQYSEYPQPHNADVLKIDVREKLRDVEYEAESIRNEIPKRLQQELANNYVDVRASFGHVIFKTHEGTYGIDLNEPDKGIREAVPVRIFGLEGYLLKKKNISHSRK